MDLITFYSKLSSLVHCIPKHSILIISRDINAQIGKDENNKFFLHNLSNRNGKHLTDLSLENRLACLNTKLQKREGIFWTDTYPNNAKTQIDYILIDKKWINSALNWEVYSSIEGVSSNHRIVTANVCLKLQRNKTQTAKNTHYNLSTLNNNINSSNKRK